MSSISRRNIIKVLGASSVLSGPWLSKGLFAQDVVNVGILHSLTGDMALTESSVVDAEKLAIEEINAAGGVMGRQIRAIVEDGASDWPVFAEKARKLMGQDQVSAVFGCVTSAARKAVLPVVEQLNNLLYYPCFYEGLEQSPNILYTGAEASQQTITACNWLLENRGKNVYLLGSDYVWPRTTNKIARATIEKLGGKVLGEEYLPLGATNFSSVINKIKLRRPDVILSTVVGGSNVALFKQILASGLDKKKTAIMTLVMTEEEVSGVGANNAEGVLTCMGYFQSLQTPENQKFVTAFKSKYGENRVTGDVMECAYNAVYLWKAAVEKANSFEIEKVVAASAGLEMDLPEGRIRFHESNHHLWKRSRIGEFGKDGQVNILFESDLIEPNPMATS